MVKQYDCPYHPCPTSQRVVRDCNIYEGCQTKKFYDKYSQFVEVTVEGSDLEIGVGATMIEDVERVRV